MTTETETPELSILTELSSLSDAHFVGMALEQAGLAYRIVEHESHGVDVALYHGFAMLYVERARFDEVTALLEQVRADEDAILDAAEAEEDDDAADEGPEAG